MICGHCAVSQHSDCNGFLRTDARFCACADRDHQPPANVPQTHRCGRCGAQAQYVDRAHSGAVLYVCWTCGDDKGHPTFVQFARYAPTEARS